MTTGWTYVCAGALVVGVALLLLELLSIEFALRHSVRASSRYALFAVRDRLVRIAVDGLMRVDDELWRDTYGGVNHLLTSRKSLIGMSNDHIRLLLSLARNREARERFELYGRRFSAACAEVPQFGEAMGAANRAVFEMCTARTSRLAFKAYRVLLKTAAVALAACSSGLRGAASFLAVARGDDVEASRFIAFQHRQAYA